jgi:hypothetical protein
MDVSVPHEPHLKAALAFEPALGTTLFGSLLFAIRNDAGVFVCPGSHSDVDGR